MPDSPQTRISFKVSSIPLRRELRCGPFTLRPMSDIQSRLDYIERRAEASAERLDGILRTHDVEPAFLRTDNFDEFFEARSNALLAKIGAAMGKVASLAAVDTEDVENFEEESPDPDDEQVLAPI